MPLTVQTNPPHANVADVEISSVDGVPCVAFAASAHGGPERLWFCFRLRNGKALQRTRGPIRLLLKHGESMLGWRGAEAVQPVIRYETGEWRRLPAGKPAPTPDGRAGAWWQIEAPDLYADVAVCYPYGQAELNAMLHQVAPCYAADAIGLSRGDRPMMRLANAYGEPNAKRPGVYLLARQHSGETPGSWVLDGLLRTFAELGEQAPLAWAVPLCDPDGVERGDYGKDAYPYDLNRAWGTPPQRQENLVLQRDIWRWSDRCDGRLVLDFHAPGLGETDGLYVFTADGAGEEQERWIGAFGEALGDYAAPDFRRVPDYPSRWAGPNACAHLRETIGCAALTVECPYARAGQTVLGIEHYREAGSRLAQAVADRLA